MKTDSLQQLLERYREGTLSDSDQAELNRLSRRDEVMAAAGERARHIIRHRTRVGIGLGAVAMAVAGVALWTLLPQHSADRPLVAETTPAVTVEATVEQPVTSLQTQHESIAMAQPVKHHATTTTAHPHRRNEAPSKTSKPELRITNSGNPVVVCNNQCEADSVISDIWKFLTA